MINTSTIIKFKKFVSRSENKVKILLIASILCSIQFTQGQVLISPTGDGGFETSTTFPLNNWAVANDGNSKWYVGTFVKTSGLRGAYIDVNTSAGAGNNYNMGQIRVSHFYRDVTIPSGATNIILSFKWKAEGENASGADQWDFLRLYLVATSVTPTAGALLPAGNIIGAGKYNLQGTVFQTASITLPNSLAGTTQRLVFTWRNDGSGGTNPGAAVDEISLTYGACSGTPVPGNTIASSNPACSGSTINFSLQNFTAGTGVTYQWQTSANGTTWGNASGATSDSYSSIVTGSGYYRCEVTCSGNSSTSNPVQITLNPSYNCVCQPSYTNSCASDYISNVSFAGINNTTGCTGTAPSNLTTYASPNPSVTGGVNYPISVTTGGDIEGINVWIDYNMNGVFESGESVLSGLATTNPQTFSGSVLIPISVATGQTKMRVRCRYNVNVTDPCNNNNFGETEDYLISLVAPPPCTTPPVAGTISGAANLCAGISSTYNCVGGTGSEQWQISTTTLGGPFSDIPGQTAASYIFTSPGSGKFYLRTKHAIAGCVDAFSNVLTVAVNPTVAVTATASSPNVCPGSTVNLNSNANLLYSNTTDYPIPDYVSSNGIVNSPILVSGFSPAVLGSATLKSVSFNINHTFVGDLRLRLFSPSGTVINLVDQAGGSGDNFVNTTVVSSGAPNGNIGAGTAPFTGTYNSQASFAGLTGATNGTWQLRAIDLAAGDAGTILDWSILFESDGLLYTWSSSPAGFSASSQNTSDTPTQSYIYSVSGSFNSCANSASVSVGLSPLPDPLAGSNSPVCAGQSITLNGSNQNPFQTSGNSYAWSGPDNYGDGSQNPTVTGSASLVQAGTYTLTVTNQFGCTSSTTTNVTVNPNPTLSVSTSTTTCHGGCDGDAVVIASNGTLPYLFSDGTNINTDGLFTDVYCAGLVTVEVFDDNGCQSTIGFTITEPEPTTLPLAGSDQSVCFGTSATLAANVAMIGSGTWTVAAGSGVFADANDPNTIVSGLSAGLNTFSWTIENSICSVSNSDNVDVTTIPLPTGVLSGSTEICNGNSTNLTISFTGTGPWLYAINGGTPVSTTNNPETVSVSPTGTTAYTITSLSDANCTGTGSGSATVSVSSAPPVGSCTINSMPSSGCSGNIISVSTTISTGATGYNWSAPSGTFFSTNIGGPFTAGPFVSPTNTIYIQLGALPSNASGWEICAFAANACGQTNTNCKYVRGALSTPAPINGSTVACPSSAGIYSTSAVSGASGYLWTGTNGITFTGSGTSVTANFPVGFNSGTICVAAQLACGYTGSSRCLNVSNGTPVLGAMTGTFTVCPGTSGVSYSVPPASGANLYTWTLPSGATIASGTGTNSITVDFGATYTVGNICVTGTSICGITSTPRCKTISSNKPNTPGNFTAGSLSGVCGQTITYSVATISGATSYTWTAPSAASLASPNGSNSVDVSYTNGFTTGNLCVTANNGCGSSAPRCVLIKGTPLTPASITGPAAVCANESGDNYSVAPVTGATSYTWLIPSGTSIVSGQGTSAIILDWGANGGVISVTATGICGSSGTRTLNVTMGCKVSGSVMPGTEINAYPNPVSNILNVDVNSVNSGVYTIELMDLSGRIVYSTTMNTIAGINSNQLDVSSYAKGMYMLSVKSSTGFVKQIRVAVE